MNSVVLVITMEDGRVQTIAREHRKVYSSMNGPYIKTRSDGNIYLQDGVAVISYRRVPGKHTGALVRRRVDEPVVEALDQAQLLLWEFGLDKTPHSVV